MQALMSWELSLALSALDMAVLSVYEMLSMMYGAVFGWFTNVRGAEEVFAGASSNGRLVR